MEHGAAFRFPPTAPPPSPCCSGLTGGAESFGRGVLAMTTGGPSGELLKEGGVEVASDCDPGQANQPAQSMIAQVSSTFVVARDLNHPTPYIPAERVAAPSRTIMTTLSQASTSLPKMRPKMHATAVDHARGIHSSSLHLGKCYLHENIRTRSTYQRQSFWGAVLVLSVASGGS